MQPVLVIIEQNQLKWFGHMLRMNKKHQLKRIWQVIIRSGKDRGRPRDTGDGVINKIKKTLEKKKRRREKPQN